MGHYPVKCYLLICRETRATAIIDTEANPEAIIKKLVSLGVKPEITSLTHTHPDYAGGGVSVLDREYKCPTWVDKIKLCPSGSCDLRVIERGEI